MASQTRSCFLDGPIGDRRMVGRLIALADTLISLGVRAPRSAETRLPECREQEGLLMRQCRAADLSHRPPNLRARCTLSSVRSGDQKRKITRGWI